MMNVTIWPRVEISNNQWLHNLYQTLSLFANVKGFNGIIDIFFRCNVLVINWVDSPLNLPKYKMFIVICYRLFILYFAKLMQIKIIWIVHNIKPHDKKLSLIGKFYMTRVISLCTTLMCMNEETPKLLWKLYSIEVKNKVNLLPHGPYLVSEESHSIDNKTFDLLMIGMIRKYKNFHKTAEFILSKTDLSTCVAGIPSSKVETECLKKLSRLYPESFTLKIKSLSANEFERFILSSKFTLIPYRDEQLNTGVGNHSLSLGIPVIGFDCPAIRQLQIDWGKELVFVISDFVEINKICKNEILNSSVLAKAKALELSKKVDEVWRTEILMS